jgi:hypothetical protein
MRATAWTWRGGLGTQSTALPALQSTADALVAQLPTDGKPKVFPRSALHPLLSRSAWAAYRLDGSGHAMKSQVVETVLLTFLSVAAAAAVYLAAVGVVAILS